MSIADPFFEIIKRKPNGQVHANVRFTGDDLAVLSRLRQSFPAVQTSDLLRDSTRLALCAVLAREEGGLRVPRTGEEVIAYLRIFEATRKRSGS